MHNYEVVVAPGCHGEPSNPVVSRHRTLRAAVARAIKSDRLRVEPSDSSVCLFQARSRQPTPYGYGLYGGATWARWRRRCERLRPPSERTAIADHDGPEPQGASQWEEL